MDYLSTRTNTPFLFYKEKNDLSVMVSIIFRVNILSSLLSWRLLKLAHYI